MENITRLFWQSTFINSFLNSPKSTFIVINVHAGNNRGTCGQYLYYKQLLNTQWQFITCLTKALHKSSPQFLGHTPTIAIFGYFWGPMKSVAAAHVFTISREHLLFKPHAPLYIPFPLLICIINITHLIQQFDKHCAINCVDHS